MKEQLVAEFRRRGRVAAVAGVVGVAAAVAVAWVLLGVSVGNTQERAGAAPAGNKRQAALTVTAVQLKRVEFTHTITVDGGIFPWREVIISPQVGGYQVAKVDVDVGDHVKKGQELVTLSSALLDAEVASRQATLNQREAALANAKSSLKRGEKLAAMDSLSASDLDQLKSAELAADAQVQAAEADLATSKLRLKFTHVMAPDSGVILSRNVTVGQVAQAGAEMLRLLRQGRVEWRGKVPEARLADLKPGQPVTVTTADGSEFAGKIRIVAPTVVDQSRTGLVYVDLASDPRLRPGMFARGDIEVGRGPALTVPLQSVVSSDGYSYAFVLKPDSTVERRRIETGAIHGSIIEVTAGLKVGESVVAKGAGFLRDGDLVNVVPSASGEVSGADGIGASTEASTAKRPSAAEEADGS